MDRQLGLELRDPLACRNEFGSLPAGQSWHLSGVDPVLSAPGVDGLVADAQVGSDRGAGAPRGDQIENLAAELGRILTRHDGGLHEVLGRVIIQQLDATKAGAHQAARRGRNPVGFRPLS